MTDTRSEAPEPDANPSPAPVKPSPQWTGDGNEDVLLDRMTKGLRKAFPEPLAPKPPTPGT